MRLNILLFSAFAASCAEAFQVQQQTVRVPTKVFSSISLERTTPREIGQFQDWAVQCGVSPENGFSLVETLVEENEDWYAATASGGAQGSRVLFVPNEMILSSARIAEEYAGYVDPALKVLGSKGLMNLEQQFYLFLRVIVEYERGAESPWYPWMAAMPRKWDTAVSMTDFCISCLPPFIKNLCKIEKIQFRHFRLALDALDFVSPESKANIELCKFAYNVVFTRSWAKSDTEHQIVPVADMLNHGHPANVEIGYDENGNCQVILKEDVQPGGALHFSYGQPSNPSRFMATFGFLDETPPATFCKIMALNPSQELKDVGYDTQRMLFYTADGAITQEVWDVVLYSMFENNPRFENEKMAFYQAHMNGDAETKGAIHGQFLMETCNTLKSHVDRVLDELAALAKKIDSVDINLHPRLSLIAKHNRLVDSTFLKVQAQLNYISESEMARRG
jgi:hypothetical protein